MFKESLKLANFKKVYPVSLLSTTALLSVIYFLNKGNASDAEQIVSLAGFAISALLFLFLYPVQSQVIGNELTAGFQDEEPEPVVSVMKRWTQYAISSVGVIVVFLIGYKILLPLVGAIAGGLFQVSAFGIELNLLTLFLNLGAIVWMMFGMAEISTIGVSFRETFSYTVNFVFTNFLKVVQFSVIFMLLSYAVLFMLVQTVNAGLYLLPVKVLVIAYVIAFLNTYATNLFIDNVSDEDFAEAEEDTEE